MFSADNFLSDNYMIVGTIIDKNRYIYVENPNGIQARWI